MKKILAMLIVVALSTFIVIWAEGSSPIPSPDPSFDISATPSTGPSGSPLPLKPRVTSTEAKVLLKEFQKAQSSEIHAIQHRQAFETRELKSAQSVREKDWLKKETEARHKFFAAHPKGADRRTYVQDFEARYKALRQSMTDERTDRAREQAERLNAIREDQAQRLNEFQEDLRKGMRPPAKLWPSPGT